MNRSAKIVEARSEEAIFGSTIRAGLEAEARKLPRAERRRVQREIGKMSKRLAASGWDTTPDGSGLLELLLIAAIRRKVVACPHVPGIPVEVAFIDLGHRRMECAACFLTDPPVEPATDGMCDICSIANPGNLYHEFVVQAGMFLVHGDCCPQCMAHIQEISGGTITLRDLDSMRGGAA